MAGITKPSVANEILQVIPAVMRVLASDIRQEPGGLAPAHFRLMVMLAKRPRSLTELAESQAVSMATMSNSISVLVERGWVARRQDPHDRRRLAIEITEKGKGALEDVYTRAKTRLQDSLASINEKECWDLMRGLEVLNRIFSRR
jgi:DNA-binding MarR family transcriptional regulator